MGNSLGGKKTVKIMKITGETMKLKTPVKAGDVIKDHPGLVLLDSEAVKHYGVRAKAIELDQYLVPKRLYFLVELPKASTEKPTRVRSGINMTAKDRLESLMLARRSASDLSLVKPSSSEIGNDGVRVKMRLPKARVDKLMQEAKDETDAAAKIINLCMAANGQSLNPVAQNQFLPASAAETSVKKRVNFLPVSEEEMQIAEATY